MSGDGKGPTITYPPYSANELLKLLDQRINNQHDYNHVISWFIQNMSTISLTTVDGMAYYTDSLRGKLLSITRPVFTAGYYGLNQKNRYLRMDSVSMAGDQGLYMPRPATICGIWAKSRSTATWYAELRKNGIPITLISVPIAGGSGSDILLNVDVNAGDHIQFYMNGNSVDHPSMSVELAWNATP